MRGGPAAVVAVLVCGAALPGRCWVVAVLGGVELQVARWRCLRGCMRCVINSAQEASQAKL